MSAPEKTTDIIAKGCPPCPRCQGEVWMQRDLIQRCQRCEWLWLPPSKQIPLVRRPLIVTVTGT